MKILVIDIDGVIIKDTGRWDDYAERKIIPGVVDKLFELSERYRLVCYTARKSEEAFWDTVRMFQTYGLDHLIDAIYFDKPIGEFYIDDRSLQRLEDL